ncbi:MAG: hypothetical protein PHS30_11910, partial [Bacteroidales bacterium]|nr:hypothetical protein [Bacteroidales bacterium]
MILLRFLLKYGALLFIGFSMFSCIDSAYNLSNLSKEIELFRNSLSMPVGTATIYLDSVIGGMHLDTTVFKVKNGKYVFGYSDSLKLGAISNTFNQFKLTEVPDVNIRVNLYDASGATTVPFDLPASEAKDYTDDLYISLPASFGSSDMVDIDSVLLKNTTMRISSTCVGLAGGNGKTLGDNMSITFTALGKAAEYYVNGVRQDSWTVRAGEIKEVEIRKINLTEIDETNKITIRRTIHVQVANAGDIKVTQKIMTYMDLKMEFTNGIDFDLIWGQVNYGVAGNITPIHFEGLSKIINENDVLSIYNPAITLNTEGNLGVPLKLKLGISTSNSRTGNRASLKDTTFYMEPSVSKDINKTNSFTLDRASGTSELFKINPDSIRLNYHVHTDTNTFNHFLAKNTNLNVTYKMEIPLEFGSDLRISIDTSFENPFDKDLDKLEDQKNLSVALTLNVKNRIPLTMRIELEALDVDG